jgi:hypothetical protein
MSFRFCTRQGWYEAGKRGGDGPLLTQEEDLCALKVIGHGSRSQRVGHQARSVTPGPRQLTGRYVIGDTRSSYRTSLSKYPGLDIKGPLFSTGQLRFPLSTAMKFGRKISVRFFLSSLASPHSDIFPDRPLQRMASLLYRLQPSQT